MPNSKIPSQNKQILAKNLKYYIEKSGKERATIANDLGVAYTTFSSWCSGVNYPRIDKIAKIANYFGIESSDLIDNHQNKKIEQSSSHKNELDWTDLGMAYGGRIPDDLKDMYRAIAEEYVKKHPEALRKNEDK